MVAWVEDGRNEYSGSDHRWYFFQDGKRVFWDVHNPENTIVIELRDERFDALVIEVADPKATVELVEAALHGE